MHKLLSTSLDSSETVEEGDPLQKRFKLDNHIVINNAENFVGLQMHSSVDVEPEPQPQEILLELGLLITEGRRPTSSSPKGFEEGPHCLRHLQKGPRNHVCTLQNHLCTREDSFRKHVEVLWRNNVPLLIEVLLCSDCTCGRDKASSPEISPLTDPSYTLLEQWSLFSHSRRGDNGEPGDECSSGSGAAGRGVTNGKSILHVVRSFLHFSQLSAWLSLSKGESPKNIMYRVTIPGEDFASKFTQPPEEHDFPTVQFKAHGMKVSVKSLPRLGLVPTLSCSNLVCRPRSQSHVNKRSQSPPTFGEIIRGGGSPRPYGVGVGPGRSSISMVSSAMSRSALSTAGMSIYSSGGRSCSFRHSGMGMIAAATPPIAGNNRVKQRQLRKEQRNERMLEYISSLQGQGIGAGMDGIVSSRGRGRGRPSTRGSPIQSDHQNFGSSEYDSTVADGVYGFESPVTLSPKYSLDLDRSPPITNPSSPTSEDLGGDEEVEDGLVEDQGITTVKHVMPSSSAISIPKRQIPTLSEKIDFLKSLDSAASRLFHRKTGLPLTSSPAPLRKGQDRFDFDSSLVSGTRMTSRFRRGCHPPRFSEATRALLGPFEESVLNGRIEPVSTVQGFTAEIGASGSFCPRHVHLPVTVFFYTFCDNDKISTPYLAHVDLGEQGYCVPRKGTVQVTLFNPLRTVIKMFVVQFNLENMPNNSQTFLRQRIYFMPLDSSDSHPSAQKWLRYLIHLRFASNESGQIFLHTDIRMVIFRKSDADTATGFDVQTPHELRSFTYAPHNPKFSPRFNQGKVVTPTKSEEKPNKTSTPSSTITSSSQRREKTSAKKFIPKKIIFQDEDDQDLVDESNKLSGHDSSTNSNPTGNVDVEEESSSEDEDDQECHEREYEYEFEPCVNHSEIEIIV